VPCKESAKGHDILVNMTSPLKSPRDPIPVLRDKRLSRLKRDQPAKPWAREERPIAGAPAWWSRFKTVCPSLVCSCLLPSLRSQSDVQCRTFRLFSAFLVSIGGMARLPRHASHLLHCEHAIPALSDGVLGTFSAPRHNIVVIRHFCGAPLRVIPRVGARVPFYPVGDVVAY